MLKRKFIKFLVVVLSCCICVSNVHADFFNDSIENFKNGLLKISDVYGDEQIDLMRWLHSSVINMKSKYDVETNIINIPKMFLSTEYYNHFYNWRETQKDFCKVLKILTENTFYWLNVPYKCRKCIVNKEYWSYSPHIINYSVDRENFITRENLVYPEIFNNPVVSFGKATDGFYYTVHLLKIKLSESVVCRSDDVIVDDSSSEDTMNSDNDDITEYEIVQDGEYDFVIPAIVKY